MPDERTLLTALTLTAVLAGAGRPAVGWEVVLTVLRISLDEVNAFVPDELMLGDVSLRLGVFVLLDGLISFLDRTAALSLPGFSFSVSTSLDLMIDTFKEIETIVNIVKTVYRAILTISVGVVGNSGNVD